MVVVVVVLVVVVVAGGEESWVECSLSRRMHVSSLLFPLAKKPVAGVEEHEQHASHGGEGLQPETGITLQYNCQQQLSQQLGAWVWTPEMTANGRESAWAAQDLICTNDDRSKPSAQKGKWWSEARLIDSGDATGHGPDFEWNGSSVCLDSDLWAGS